MPERRGRPIAVVGALVALGGLLSGVAGCGHPASREECELILAKLAELELREQQLTDPEQINRKIEEARASRGEDLLAGCIGRRITDGQLACVRGAQRADDVTGRCLD